MGDRTPSTLAEAYQRHGYRLSDFVAPEEHERIRQETLNELKRELAGVRQKLAASEVLVVSMRMMMLSFLMAV